MTAFTEYDQFDGVGLAGLVKRGKISATELCEEAIRRAENDKLNAITTKMYEFARKAARLVPGDAPFCGVPFLVKDAHHAVKGVAMSSGSRLLTSLVPDYDAEIVTRFKNAGLVILGKTNTPEFKLGMITEPKAFGPTRNPWDLEFSPGGSSGGSAAAVAAGIVPLASATDEGGSIRIPASYCGLFGLKPSRGRTPVGPDFDEELDGTSCSHVLARSVRDSAAMLDAISGLEGGAPYGTCSNPRPFLDEVRNEPKPLRVAFHTRAAYGREVHPECAKAVEHTCRLLEKLGHRVEESAPDYAEEEAALNWTLVVIGDTAALVEKLMQLHNPSAVRRGVEPTTLAMYCVGRRLTALDFIKAKRRWRELGIIMDRMLTKYDVVLTPTLGEPPVRIGSQELKHSDQFAMALLSSVVGRVILASRRLTFSIVEEVLHNSMKGQMPFTLIANVTGQPAMSVPLYWSKDGLPCGVQFIGRYGDEATLFRLAGQLENAQPWFDRKPPYSYCRAAAEYTAAG